MTPEILYVKDDLAEGGKEKALVVQTERTFTHMPQSAEFVQALKELSLEPALLHTLIQGNFSDRAKPVQEVLQYGDVEEKVTVRTTEMNGEPIEVSYCHRDQASSLTPQTVEMQLRQQSQAAKILVGLRGEAVLRIPEQVEPAGMLYHASGKGENIHFERGTIAIIQAPTAWTFASSGEDFSYLYISTPPHSSHGDVEVENT